MVALRLEGQQGMDARCCEVRRLGAKSEVSEEPAHDEAAGVSLSPGSPHESCPSSGFGGC